MYYGKKIGWKSKPKVAHPFGDSIKCQYFIKSIKRKSAITGNGMFAWVLSPRAKTHYGVLIKRNIFFFCDLVIPLGNVFLSPVLNFWKVLLIQIYRTYVYWNNVRNSNGCFCLENFTTLMLFSYTAAESLSRNNKTLSKGQTKECRPSYIHAPTSYWSSHIKGLAHL